MPGSSTFRPYTPAVDSYDEVIGPEGRPRQHWERLAQATTGTDATELERRARAIRHAVEQDGVTYNVHGDPKGADRLWEVDQLPLVIGADEWRFLAAAVRQRARLLNAILADLYGPARLIRMGMIPPAIIYGHHNYLWPCRGLQPPEGIHLHLYGCDLARSPDGRWWVINDRTQGPSGAGYALQNRRIVAPLYGALFRSLGVQGLSRFFRTLQEQLAALAPTRGEIPNIVLLTPGPYSETYFEHVFLARHLGFPLVEGSDLTVRNGRVFLKTLEGLRRVHVILRRLDDEYCDPVALRADSTLGVPGLLSAARAGQVVVANALGSGVLESPALPGFLPAISEALLGESLALPSVGTWWCGEAPALEHVVNHLPELVVKAAFPSMRLEPTFGHSLDRGAREALASRIRATPHAFVAQERVRLSQAPTWSTAQHRFESRVIGMRLYAVATAGGGYEVMQGGLSRVSPEPGAEVISIQRGGSSKDTWVLDDTVTTWESLRPPPLTAREIVRGGPFYPSRAVENLFWFGRYSERMEGIARLLRVTAQRLIEGDAWASGELEVFISLCTDAQLRDESLAGPTDARRDARFDDTDRTDDDWLIAVVGDPTIGNGLPANAARLLHSASQLRERISLDNWHMVQRLAHMHEPQPHDLESAINLLDRVVPACTSLAGFALDDMTRDDAWRFLLIGRQIERLTFIASTIAKVLARSLDDPQRALTGLLEVGNSLITYRARYQRQPELIAVTDLLVLDPSNPHSVQFQLDGLCVQVRLLIERFGFRPANDPRSVLERLQSLDLARFENLPYAEPLSMIEALREILGACEGVGYQLSEGISQRFFIHVSEQHQTIGQT